MNYVALILVCASNITVPNCSLDNAIDVLNGLTSNTPIDCLMNSQSLIANSQMALVDMDKDGIEGDDARGDNAYIKVVCVPSTGVVYLDPR